MTHIVEIDYPWVSDLTISQIVDEYLFGLGPAEKKLFGTEICVI
jgi:hypothetical protein